MTSAVESTRSAPARSIAAARADFPALAQRVHGKPLVYLDSAATALKPRRVIDAVVRMYERDCANVHRGVHLLSQRATDAYEQARERVARFLSAPATRSVVFTRGTTESINLIADVLVRARLREGDEVLITALEHHSNLVPWQLACERAGARLVVAPVADDGDVTLGAFEAALSARTRVAAFAHASNTLGTVLPVKAMTRAAHARGALVVVDGAQAAPHLRVDVSDLDVDFYAFSGHKAYGPTGIGVLYGRPEVFEALPPYHGGGGMIRSVTFEKTTYKGLPDRFEAGTPDIAGAVGLGEACEYLSALDFDAIAAHERDLLSQATRAIAAIDGVRIIGTAADKIGVVSFVVGGVHPHDLGTILDTEGVAVRTGHHCTQPLMDRFGVAATTRASFGVYNTAHDVERLASAVRRAQEIFS